MTLVPIGGLANRMLAITSAIHFCLQHKVQLRIVWFRDWGMGADFHDLFELAPDMGNVEVIDAKWYHYIYDRPRKRNLWLPYLYQKFAFGYRAYENLIYKDGISIHLCNYLGGWKLALILCIGQSSPAMIACYEH